MDSGRVAAVAQLTCQSSPVVVVDLTTSGTPFWSSTWLAVSVRDHDTSSPVRGVTVKAAGRVIVFVPLTIRTSYVAAGQVVRSRSSVSVAEDTKWVAAGV